MENLKKGLRRRLKIWWNGLGVLRPCRGMKDNNIVHLQTVQVDHMGSLVT